MVDTQLTDRIAALVEAVLEEAGLELVDLEGAGAMLRVFVDRPGGGIDVDTLGEVSRALSARLDEAGDAGDFGDGRRWVLEVSSPGVERRLRTPEHFRSFVGSEVTVKTVAGTPGDRRLAGRLEAADAEGISVVGRRLSYPEIEHARTKFAWPEPAPRPGGGAGRSRGRSGDGSTGTGGRRVGTRR